MTTAPTLAALFDRPTRPPAPDGRWRPEWQWGMRGDPHLWRALQERFATEPLPADAAALDTLVRAAFVELTGRTLDEADAFFVERFAHGGLSSGCVLPKWWRETGLPHLRERLAAARAARD